MVVSIWQVAVSGWQVSRTGDCVLGDRCLHLGFQGAYILSNEKRPYCADLHRPIERTFVSILNSHVDHIL